MALMKKADVDVGLFLLELLKGYCFTNLILLVAVVDATLRL